MGLFYKAMRDNFASDSSVQGRAETGDTSRERLLGLFSMGTFRSLGARRTVADGSMVLTGLFTCSSIDLVVRATRNA
jgi:hypothetical protein